MRIIAPSERCVERIVGVEAQTGDALFTSLDLDEQLRQTGCSWRIRTRLTCGALSKIFSPSCWATHPSTAKVFPFTGFALELVQAG